MGLVSTASRRWPTSAGAGTGAAAAAICLAGTVGITGASLPKERTEIEGLILIQ